MYLEYHGWYYIEYWEYAMLFFYLIVIYLYFARRKNLMVKKRPEYRYLLWGLYAKLLGGVAFSLIYFYYYGGGDTIGYFSCSLAMSKLFFKAPLDFFRVLFGPSSLEMRQYFDLSTGYPYIYVITDPHQWTVVRLVSPLTILCFNSYLITTVVVAGLTYTGIWRLYVTLYRYFPSLHMELAVAVLFMPSTVLWGSAILKDSFTFAAFCWYLYGVDRYFFVKQDKLSAIYAMILSSIVILSIKPYIFMAVFPASILWVSYKRLASIRSTLVKYILLPFMFLAMIVVSLAVLNALGDSLGKFSLSSALDTIVITQTDLKRADEYGSNYFDVGELQATWGSVLSKFPVALNAALFRPYLTECHNFTMVMAGLENLWLLVLFIRVLWISRLTHFITCIVKNPMVLTFISFTVVFGFITGITTPNFGALVRFKIPLLPLFVSSMYIVRFLMKERESRRLQGLRFSYERYRTGEPGSLASLRVIELEEARKKGK